MKKQTLAVIVMLVLVVLIAMVPLFALASQAEFGGADGAGSEMVAEIQGEEYEPWFTPVMETALGAELPGEIESLFFCVQVGIGVGIIAYCFGYLVARKKYGNQTDEDALVSEVSTQ